MRLFITGTDTEVGKSVITASLAAALRPIWALKPLATGEPPPGTDALLISTAAGHPPQVYRTSPIPAAPHRAFHQASLPPLAYPALLAWINRFEGAVLIEGVGGWEVPLGDGRRVSDLAVDLAAPVVLVAANKLGVINHTLLTAAAIRARGLRLVGVALNHPTPAPPDALADWNREDLRAELDVPVVPCPHISIPEGLITIGETLVNEFNLR